ncbi:hypothetical protein [Acanthopleuribacter pedis]|uniref:Uncharacterized protein n=1 Tax=Acanthopleuribacter pedis TaxID=442870 RepID=A0A8J7QGB1_9BACT|nr:hypothetical protein [Acanthopleuribacter pedis]MBO1319535.1 hypothetical protein [Acanthopleuribacter pedis]
MEKWLYFASVLLTIIAVLVRLVFAESSNPILDLISRTAPVIVLSCISIRDLYLFLRFSNKDEGTEELLPFGQLAENIKDLIDKEKLKELTLKKNIDNYIEFCEVYSKIELSRKRLKSAIQNLKNQGYANLILGMSISIIGVLLLSVDVLRDNFVFENFAPKLAMSLIIQSVGFFFLSLYKNSISEIKYFQNELTNIESKMIAVTLANQGVSHNARVILDELARTERNFVLKKGETTATIEMAKMIPDNIATTSGWIKNIISREGKKK